VPAIGLTPSRAVIAEDVRDLQSWLSHGRRRYGAGGSSVFCLARLRRGALRPGGGDVSRETSLWFPSTLSTIPCAHSGKGEFLVARAPRWLACWQPDWLGSRASGTTCPAQSLSSRESCACAFALIAFVETGAGDVVEDGHLLGASYIAGHGAPPFAGPYGDVGHERFQVLILRT
jgi:hypothetical protein